MAHVTEKYFNELVETAQKLIRFDSSQKPAEGKYPFGKETAECLDCFLEIAQNMGFSVRNYDHYVGEIEYGEGDDFAVLAHLDVVPAGKGWKYPPFAAIINDDLSEGGVGGAKLWGRGTSDDKGPAVATLYALKALKDEGFMPKRKIKFILGCNEESGWACIDHYKKVAKMPDEGFSPDADFPAIFAEKGILHFNAKFALKNPPFTSLSAGERVNMVCGEAIATLTPEAAEKLKNYSNPVLGTVFTFDEQTNAVTVKGKSAHGSTPEKGANALGALLAFFATLDDGCKRAYELLFKDSTGLKQMHDLTGYLTLSPDVAAYENGVLTITVDVRFPSTYTREEVKQRLQEGGLDYEVVSYQPPIYTDPESKLVKTLMRVYNEETGRNESAVAIGGGTYARALKRGCGFGPCREDEEAVAHQANEYITLDSLKQITRIYYEAIKALTE